eukprot:6882960-Pyramimonas_sp.AAC.1
MAQEGPKRGPRGDQDGTNSAQERPKGPQEAISRGPGGDLDLDFPSFDRWPPRWPQEALQESPKRAP